MRKNKVLRLLSFFIISIFTSCSMFSVERTPYTVSAYFVMEEKSSDYEICGVELEFYNWSQKEVKEFEIIFYLFDSDGEPAQECGNQLAFNIEKKIKPEETFRYCLKLDKYMTSIPEYMLNVDYLYVRKICYSDGSVWEDPFGMAAFM